MEQENIALIIGALDSLGLSLADHDHQWTAGERAIYEKAIEILQITQPNPTTGDRYYRTTKRGKGVGMSHHPSCRESDKSLIWFCNQCGEKESADEEQIIAAAQQPLVDALNFFASVIKSGESWSATCQKAYDAALAKVKEGK